MYDVRTLDRKLLQARAWLARRKDERAQCHLNGLASLVRLRRPSEASFRLAELRRQAA